MSRRKRPTRTRHPNRVAVRVDQDPVDVCRETARQFYPDVTDEELAQGLRDLADQIERDAAKQRAAV